MDTDEFYLEDLDYPSILDKLNFPIIIADLSATIVYYNHLAKKMLENTNQGNKITNLKKIDGVRSILETTDDMTHMLSGKTITRTIQISDEGDFKTYVQAHLRILKNKLGMPEFLLINAQDLTPQQLVEKQLMESEEKYRTILDNPFQAVVHYKNDHIIDVNSTFYDLFGYKNKDEVLNRHFSDLVDHRSAMKISSTPSEKRGVMDLTGVKKDGTLFPVRAVGKNIIIKGEEIRVVSIRDMSKPQKTEQELSIRSQELEKLNKLYKEAEGLISNNEKLVAVGRMAANIAHDLRQPLQILQSQVEVYHLNRQMGEDMDYHEMYTQMLEQIQRSNQILHSLQNLGRDDIKDDYNFVITRPNTVIEQIISLVDGDLRRNEIEILYNNYNGEEMTLDTLKMSQVLMNLIINARDAIQDQNGNKVITINSAFENGFWVCQIIDNGDGISPSNMNKIFKPFFTTKRPDKGTGLGLSISKRIIEQHGGTLQYLRKNGQTIFEIRIPTK